jgi:predicted nicotinamide N-methyase
MPMLDMRMLQELAGLAACASLTTACQRSTPQLHLHAQSLQHSTVLWQQHALTRCLPLPAFAGIVGLAAACMGARVCMTDLPEQMHQMQENIDLNQQLITDCGGSAMISPLDWSQSLPDDVAACERWDYIIGADLVYEPEAIAPLAALFDDLLARYPEAVMIISHRHREQALDDDMMRGLYARGLQLLQYQNTTDQGQVEEAICVYQVTRVQG